MTPNADRDNPASIPLNQETFLMSNMVPQAPNNNQGPWADLENFLRTLLPANEVYVIAGPAGVGVERRGAGGALAAAEHVGAHDEPAVGVDRLARPDEVLLPGRSRTGKSELVMEAPLIIYSEPRQYSAEIAAMLSGKTPRTE